jgi:hypothetical protein
MSKPIYSNYGDLEEFLEKNDIEYHKLASFHYRILGPVALVDIWPGQMTCHIIVTEGVDTPEYFKLDRYFNEAQVDAVLNGRDWRKL